MVSLQTGLAEIPSNLIPSPLQRQTEGRIRTEAKKKTFYFQNTIAWKVGNVGSDRDVPISQYCDRINPIVAKFQYLRVHLGERIRYTEKKTRHVNPVVYSIRAESSRKCGYIFQNAAIYVPKKVPLGTSRYKFQVPVPKTDSNVNDTQP